MLVLVWNREKNWQLENVAMVVEMTPEPWILIICEDATTGYIMILSIIMQITSEYSVKNKLWVHMQICTQFVFIMCVGRRSGGKMDIMTPSLYEWQSKYKPCVENPTYGSTAWWLR